ncbi:MAG: Ger(x)C family spore germination protein [Cohnella sp.]|nr:Ger(x)C family spore germination protein [Cohnella sp.]
MMRRRLFAKLLLAAVLLLTLPACWDYREIHKLNYLTTLGVDYQNGEIVLYVQSLNFNSIAKQEGGRLPSTIPSLIGTSRGPTIGQAIFELYRSEQFRVYWGHLTGLIFSKAALEHVGLIDLTDLFNRFREIRYNIWLYGTEEPIDKLLTAHNFFQLSIYDSLLLHPQDTYRQYSYMKPIYTYRALSDLFERGTTMTIPNLTLTDSHWREGEQKTTELVIDGGYFFRNRRYIGRLSGKQLSGAPFMDKKMNRALLSIDKDGKPTAGFVMISPKYAIKHRLVGDKVVYDLDYHIDTYMEEMLDNAAEQELTKALERKLQEQIRYTFEQGRSIHADVFNLNEHLHRHHYKQWKRIFGDGVASRDNFELGKVDAHVLIRYSGKYKAKIAEKEEPT